MINDRPTLPIAFIVLSCALSAQAQQPSAAAAATVPLTLADAVQLAVTNYPAVQEQRARARAAEEGIAVARTAYLPRVDAVWQENRATHNNVFGILFPQIVVPPVSGAPVPRW